MVLDPRTEKYNWLFGFFFFFLVIKLKFSVVVYLNLNEICQFLAESLVMRIVFRKFTVGSVRTLEMRFL